jgi:hypothetical protein
MDTPNQARHDLVMSTPTQFEGHVMPPALTDAIKGLWQDSGVQLVFKRRNELQINDSAP